MSCYNTLSVLLPYMKKKGGYVVNVSSMLGYMGIIGYSDYTMSKFGVIGLTEALRNEYMPYKISFSVLCPSDTDTPGYKNENKTKPYDTQVLSGNINTKSARAVAKICLKGIRKNRFIINTSFMAKLTWILKRYFPRVIFNIIDSDVKKALKKK